MATPKKEYFNLYVEFHNTESSEDELFNTFVYTLLDADEINQYIELIKRKSWGEHTIGNHNLQVFPAHTIKIFDLSKVVEKGDDYSREELLKMVPLRPETEDTLFEQLERYGADVTKEMFGAELEILLNKLQFEIQIEQRGINAETGELGSLFSEGNIKDQIKGESSFQANSTGKILPLFPKEFQEGILDGSVEPAFNVEKIASVFSDHLKNLKHENGQMVGVFGQWGRGKTYFINKVFEQLSLIRKGKEKIPFLKRIWNIIKSTIYKIKSIPKKKEKQNESSFFLIKFQAWRYQQTQSIWAYLFESFLDEFLNVVWWKRIGRYKKLSLTRQGHWKSWIWPLLGIITGVFAFSFTSKLTDDKDGQLIIKILGSLGTVAISFSQGKSLMEKIKNPAINIFNNFSKAPSFKSVLGVQAEIEKELKHLLKAWQKYIGDKRILLFVDDLDRCSEDQIIEIIDSLRVMLDDKDITKQVLILVALDEDKLKRAIKVKYKNLFEEKIQTDQSDKERRLQELNIEKRKLQDVVNEYMDKLFISAIKLYPISFDERSEFVRKLANQINHEDNTEKELTTASKPSPTPTPTLGTNSTAKLGGSSDSGQGTAPISTPSPTPTTATNVPKSDKNLEDVEVAMLQEKIKLANKELTPRQIRILIYRYLLARNLWKIFFDETDWNHGDAIDEIMRFSGYSKEDSNAETKINSGLSKIARMVVAY